jgi:ribulose-phosphate 3-epimerase
MDGVFVSNMSFGLAVIESLRKKSNAVLDVHLMITKPEKYIERYITEAGADIVTFHYEATDVIDECIETIKKHGKKCGISIKPATPAEAIFPYLDRCDMILVMTVEPGYGGQSLIPEMLDKVKTVRAEIERRGLSVDVQVDGGINTQNAHIATEAGANVLVAGSAVFKADDKREVMNKMRK